MYETTRAKISLHKTHHDTLKRTCNELEQKGFEVVSVIPDLEENYYYRNATILYRTKQTQTEETK
jgi:hypothetical protein